MAEGMVNHYLSGLTPVSELTPVSGTWEAYSAGTEPAGYVHPLAVRVMAELGIDISEQRSKPVEAVQNLDLDLVVTVCDDAAENCPVWLGMGRRRHLAFEDPAGAAGSEDERLAVFRRVRDEIRREVLQLLMNETPE